MDEAGLASGTARRLADGPSRRAIVRRRGPVQPIAQAQRRSWVT